MSDIFREVDEDLRRDQIMKFWKRYGGLVIAAAILVVAATAGNVGWKHWRTTRMEERTAVLSEALAKLRPADENTQPDTKGAAEALAAASAKLGAGHADLARLYEAGLRARDGQRDDAVKLYDQVAGTAGADPMLRDLATLLSVQLQLDTGDAAALRGRLAPLLKAGAWKASATEASGLLAARAGDNAGAAALFKELSEDATAPQGLRARATELAALYAATK
ncbi:tetratricopeptide repeat protein [Niveispirillum sp. KHB5.9]|uniref:tetratricopeptide repeat protein n=1 Tax=Niveispirillum sp. KHB5.9 TaxID=3400269 RepID=UPI003A8771D5